MKSRSVQPLFSYTDEFLRSEWVKWSEEYLYSKPANSFHNSRGFQQLAKARSSDIRSRAREAYRVGLLRAPLIAPRGNWKTIPNAWQSVIDGNPPHTTLGLYAYVVGRIIKAWPSSESAQSALDTLASIQMLHIGFEYGGRWYTTALIFEFAKNELQKLVARELSSRELRYLSAAVFNTLESERGSELLKSYRKQSSLKFLYFDISDRGLVRFELGDLENIAKDKSIDVNQVRRKKAALFWSQEPRGIHSRATRSESGNDLIATLTEVDRVLCQQNIPNLLSEVYVSIEKNRNIVDIFQNAESKFSTYEHLLERWHLLTYELDEISKVALEIPDFGLGSNFLKFALSTIQAYRTGTTDQVIDLLDSQSEFASVSNAFAMQTQQMPDKRYTEDMLSQYIDDQFESILVETPTTNKSQNKTNDLRLSRSKWNYDSANVERKFLGDRGEQFVYLFERNRLKRIGRQELANRVLWVSREMGDGYGYDILSFDNNGDHVFIEVKSTTKGKFANFFLSANELEVSKEKKEQYKIYRVFDLSKEPKIFIIDSPVETFVSLAPTQYRATIN